MIICESPFTACENEAEFSVQYGKLDTAKRLCNACYKQLPDNLDDNEKKSIVATKL